MKLSHLIEEVEDYRGDHKAANSESGAPIWNVSLNGIFPKDFYQGRGHEYLYTQHDREAYNIVAHLHGKPNRSLIVYRAVPKDSKIRINSGDWVTPVKKYAIEHGESNLGNEFRITQKTVNARDLFTDGDLSEWGYDPQPRNTEGDTRLYLKRKIHYLMRMKNGEIFKHMNDQPGAEYYQFTSEQYEQAIKQFEKELSNLGEN